MRALIACTADLASINIRDCLLSLGSWDPVGTIFGHVAHLSEETLLCMREGMHLDFEDVDRHLAEQARSNLKGIWGEGGGSGIDHIVFLSKHRSERNVNSLTVHAPGNYSKAIYGGRANALPPSAPREMSSALRALNRAILGSGLDERAGFEVTHHGPYLTTPSYFIEIGSVEERWAARELGEIIATSLLDTEQASENVPIAIGIGGGHYAPRFTDAALRSRADIGHMVPDYQMTEQSRAGELAVMAARSTPGCSAYILHGTSGNRDFLQVIETYLRGIGLEPVER